MRRALSLVSLLSCYSLAAGEMLLDSVLSKEEQRKTGIDKLSPMQKIELEAWLNRTFTLKAHETQQATSLSLSLNIDNGKKYNFLITLYGRLLLPMCQSPLCGLPPFPLPSSRVGT